MKKTIAVIISSIVIILFICFLVLPKKQFSENENRYLAKIPQFNIDNLINGEYTKNIEEYLADHFPGRDFFVGLKTQFFKVLGMNKINGVYLGKDEYLLEEYETPKNTKRIVTHINEWIDKLENTVDVTFLLAPTSVSIYKEKLPRFAVNADQQQEIIHYYNMVNATTVDVYDTFEKVKDNVDLYYRLDHHWTTHGAYVAYVEYCKTVGIKPANNVEFEQISNNFYGTLYSKTNEYTLNPDMMYRIKDMYSNYTVKYGDSNKLERTLYEETYLMKKDKYSYFLDNNHYIIEITNNETNTNEELLIIKDSYANAFVPFLVGHYKKIHIIDPRFYKKSISEYVKEKEIKNVLFLYNIKTIDNDLGIISIL